MAAIVDLSLYMGTIVNGHTESNLLLSGAMGILSSFDCEESFISSVNYEQLPTRFLELESIS
jgi:hypothetical protein